MSPILFYILPPFVTYCYKVCHKTIIEQQGSGVKMLYINGRIYNVNDH